MIRVMMMTLWRWDDRGEKMNHEYQNDALYNLESGSWLVWANDTAAQPLTVPYSLAND